MKQINFQNAKIYLPSGRLNFTAALSDKSGQVASSTIAVEYESGIALSFYFAIGSLGIALGYLVRIVIDTLGSLPKPPAMALPDAPTPGPLGRFISVHYYLVDFMVSLLLGFAALVALVKEGHPPETGSAWYSALVLGLGLGLFTNSDLITRLRTR